MNVASFIRQKRSGQAHSPEELQEFVQGIAGHTIPDYQISAWLMAVCWRGMTMEETAEFTRLLATTGQVLDLSAITRPKVDKHSTGGVGDKVTPVLGPLVASAGAALAKLSGRGLGHTGGTIDKLESIPGFRADLSIEEFIRQVQQIGIAIISQTQDLAPVDGVLYALRDVTATVESIPLIAASVLSKKFAAGTDIILIDVKYGSGAFMKDLPSAHELAQTMVEVGKRLNKAVSVVITGMEQPLGSAVGNGLEMIEVIETLRGKGPADLEALCLDLSAILVHMAGLAPTLAAAKDLLRQNIANGKALEKFRELITAQGGDAGVIERPELMARAQYRLPLKTEATGYVQAIDALAVGDAVKLMGGGRAQKDEAIDYAVGVLLERKAGDRVAAGDTLATIHANDLVRAEVAAKQLQAAFHIGAEAPAPVLLVQEVLLSGQ